MRVSALTNGVSNFDCKIGGCYAFFIVGIALYERKDMKKSTTTLYRNRKKTTSIIDFFFMSVSHAPQGAKKNEGWPARKREEVMARLLSFPRAEKLRIERLLQEVGHDDFWTKTLFVQAIRMLDAMERHHMKQVDIAIAIVLAVKESLLSRYKKFHRYHPGEKRPRSGPKNVLDDVFPRN